MIAGPVVGAMILYDSLVSPFAARCRIQLHAKGLAFDVVDLAHPLPADYRGINPIGKVPALRVDGELIPESAVIAEFLEDAYPEPALRPREPLVAARVRLLARIGDLYVMAPMERLFAQTMATEPDQEEIALGVSGIERGLDFLERFLDGGRYAAGDSLTIADCALVPVLHYVSVFCPMFGREEPFSRRPRVDAYLKGARTDPHVSAVMAEVAGALDCALGR